MTFGPAVILRLPHGWGVEFDALYRRVAYRYDSSFFSLAYSYTRATGNSWQFPILLRKSLVRGIYVGAGYAPQIINGGQDVTSVQATTMEATAYTIGRYHLPGDWQTSRGVVAEGGWEQRAGRLYVAPEVRYIRWTTRALDVSGSRGFFIGSQQNEVQLMLTVRFP